VFVEDEERLDKVLSARGACPALSRIVIFDMKGLREFHDPQCISLSSFADRSPQGGDWAVAAREVTEEQPAIVLFPRGDAPEPVTLTHRQVIQMLGLARERLALTPRDNRLVVLSMAEITERVWGLYAALDSGCISNYLESPDTAFENLQELQPTVFGADAEAWAHLHNTATRTAKSATRVQRLAYNWAIRAGRLGGSGGSLANLLVLGWVRREFGLSRVRLAYTGLEPISPPALDWAKSLGIIIQRIEEPIQDNHQTDSKFDPVMQQAHA
jgi:long-chain acyl-CoA synthetase